MPKKTRRQKILAEKRRPAIPMSPEASPVLFRLDTVPTAPIKHHVSEDPAELSVIKKDLTKTIILAFGAIMIELGLYRVLSGM